ncbi:MAG: threonine synthase [Candidatus Krumholzibacteriota bacterium]|nr:threonine synthase [Candidatus Krumholzibacteriota bacterium]
MTVFEGYRCGLCGREVPAGSIAGECPTCAGPLLGVYDLAALRARTTREEFFGAGEGVWRFRGLLPVFPREITLGEGNTPILDASRLRGGSGLGGLFLKDESLNPTGSFKARGMAVAVSRLVDLGARRAAVPSAGNAGLALAAYGAAAGIACDVFIPADTPAGVAEECRLYGARVVQVAGVISDAAGRMAGENAETGAAVMSTFREPCRVEGKKTMAFEIAAALSPPPDWIIYPTGGGTGIVAMWKAFAELDELGWLEGPRPRLAAVQAAGCQPLVRAFEDGRESAGCWEAPETVAAGLRVPSSRADRLILRALRETGGTAVAVDDEAILEAVGRMAAETGVFPSPEGAATLAGLDALVARETIKPGDRVCLLVTAGGSRYRLLLDDSAR